MTSEIKYPNFRFGLLFSKNESFPNAILEYIKLNLDVIAYNTGDIKRLMKNEGLIFNTRNPKKIAKKMDLYISKKRNKFKNENLKSLIYPHKMKNCFLF